MYSQEGPGGVEEGWVDRRVRRDGKGGRLGRSTPVGWRLGHFLSCLKSLRGLDHKAPIFLQLRSLKVAAVKLTL